MRNHKRKKAEPRRGRTPFSVKIGILTTVLVLAVALAVVVMAPGLNITEVYCEGNDYVTVDEIISASQIENGENIFLARIGRAEKNISKLPTVKDVTVRRVFPDKICVSIEERTPYAYIMHGSDYAAIDAEQIVLSVESGDNAFEISKNIVPPFENVGNESESTNFSEKSDNTDGENSKDDDVKSAGESNDSGESDNSENSENSEDSAQGGNGEATAEDDNAGMIADETSRLFSIPVITGIELKDAREGREAKCGDETGLAEVMKICSALNEAGLLNRTTYIDVSDIMNIRLVIENRLDVQLASSENIEYRAKFLAEVINNKISAYERAVLNYTGNDIYVRTPEDGKNRVSESAKKELEKSQKSRKSSDTDDKDEDVADEENENTDENDDEDEDDENAAVRRSDINL